MDYSKYLLVSDIDGTALIAGKPIPEANIKAINDFVEKGGRFTICTGRGSKSASVLTSLINLKEPAIICNGTCVYDYRNDKVIYTQTLPSKASKIIKEFIINFPKTGIEVVKEPKVYICNMSEAAEKHLKYRNMQCELKTIDDVGFGLNKVVFICDLNDKEAIDAYLLEATQNDDEIDYVWTNDHLVELVPAKASKATGLLKLCEALNIDINNVVAVGDYYNDIELLKAAKVKILVDNAPEELKEMADIVVGDCLSGGLAQVINDFESIVNKYIEGE